MKSYALALRPIELNVRDNIEGEELFLYDTRDTTSIASLRKKLPLSFVNYFIRNFNKGLLNRFVLSNYMRILKNKLKISFHS